LYANLQKNKSKKNVNQADTEAIKKKKLTSRQRKALIKIIEKKQKSQKVRFLYFLLLFLTLFQISLERNHHENV